MRNSLFLFLLISVACSTPKPQLYEIEWLSLPTSSNSSLPYLEQGLDGVLRCSWVETSGDTATLKFSEFRNEQWSSSEWVASGTDWFVNWADYPKISASEETMIAHYLQKSSPDTYAYDIKAQVRNATGWNEPFKVHSDTTQTEHGFVSIIPMKGNQFRFVWLDGRNTSGAHAGAMTLRTAVLNQDGALSGKALLDDRVCDCCATAATWTVGGPLVAYRDRSDDEIRDIQVTKLNDEEWVAPHTVNHDFWEISGCPVNGPAIDAKEKLVALSWFTGAQNRPRVQLSFSKDAGQSFEAPILIDDQEPFGRTSVKLLGQDLAAVVWLARNGEQAQIRLKLVMLDGRALKEMVITQTSGARGSGFPQIALYQDYIYFANTHLESQESQVRVGRIKYR